jgi:hypothetical protein
MKLIDRFARRVAVHVVAVQQEASASAYAKTSRDTEKRMSALFDQALRIATRDGKTLARVVNDANRKAANR